ncbi:hypothetical protein STIAU_4652, partial [Stigmatella aurantiaca DW4/3-1]
NRRMLLRWQASRKSTTARRLSEPPHRSQCVRGSTVTGSRPLARATCMQAGAPQTR